MSMSNLKHSPEDFKTLVGIGISAAEVSGYQITDGDQQALNEHFGNKLEQGFEVPEEYIYDGISRKELEMRYQELSMYETELKRCGKEEIIDDIGKWERMGYEEDELEHDEDEHDYVPEHIYNIRRQKERDENAYLQGQKSYSKKKKNAEVSKKLVQMLNTRQERMEEKRRENEETSRVIVKALKRKGGQDDKEKEC